MSAEPLTVVTFDFCYAIAGHTPSPVADLVVEDLAELPSRPDRFLGRPDGGPARP